MRMKTYRRSRRGVSGIIATILLVAITIAAGVALWTFRIVSLPYAPPTFTYVAQGGVPEPVYGDGTDCSGGGFGDTGNQVCLTLPATLLIISSHDPEDIPLTNLFFDMTCNGTTYLSASFASIEWVPGENAAPGAGAPELGSCGTFLPPRAYFDRLAFFDQATPGATSLEVGDMIVIYDKTFYCDDNGVVTSCDEDFHGFPPWCISGGANCQLRIQYETPDENVTVANIPMTDFSAVGCPPSCYQSMPAAPS